MNIREFAWALFPICDFESQDLITERIHRHFINTVGDEFLKKISLIEISELENSRDQILTICNKFVLNELDTNFNETRDTLKSYYCAIALDAKIFEIVFNRKFSKNGEKCLYWGSQCDPPFEKKQ